MKIFLVGGAVRDQLLGLPVHDKDYVVLGSCESEMLALGFKKISKAFPVFLHPDTREEYVLARKEKKIGPGYHGFQFNTKPEITLSDDLIRRDLTINAMAMDENGALYDPLNATKDIQQKVLRHASNAFSEDPVRIIRVARFAAKFHYLGFSISDETFTLMKKMVKNGELSSLSGERIYHEIYKAFLTPHPELFFQVLHRIHLFNYILQPLHELFINPNRAFLPLKTAIKHNCPDFYILFTLLIYQLKDEQNIKDAAKILKMPRSLIRLIIDTHSYHNMINHPLEYSAPQLLKMFKKTNALRDISHIKKVIKVCYFIAKALNTKTVITDITLSIIKKLHAESYNSIIGKSYSTDYIKEKIKNKQHTLISEYLHEVQN